MRQAAHDLASILTVSNGHRQKAAEHLEKAQLADERAMQLCRKMLSGNLSPAPGVFDLNVVVEELVSLQSTGLIFNQYEVPLPVAGDALAILRALLNLCMNAQKAGADQIVVRTRGEDAMAVVSIDDNGSGMPAAMLMNLWDQPKSADHLHGYGLPIVKRTVEAHGGTVKVQSAPGQGTTFSIYLPLASVGTLAA
jgi:signal transduction histidine kinase